MTVLTRLGICVAVVCSISSSAWAVECPLGNETLVGSYLHTFQGNGYLIGPTSPLPSASAASFVSAGHSFFDGAGHFEWRDSASLGGLPILDRVLQANYQIDPATCLGTYFDAVFGEFVRFVAARDGSGAHVMNSFNGVKIVGTIRKVPSGACSATSFDGSYRSIVDGNRYKGGAGINTNGPSLGFAGVGRLVADTTGMGGGIFEWSTTDSNAGRIEQRTLRGTHNLDFASCIVYASAHEECVDGSCRGLPPGAWTGRFTASPLGDHVVFLNTTVNVTVNGLLERQ